MITKIRIEHETAEALKNSPLWSMIESLLFVDGPVSVVEIDGSENED